MANTDLTADVLRELLHYDQDTGIFTWLKSKYARYNGKPAGAINVQGYRQIEILGTKYKAHRLAWLYVHGHQPPECIDHINRDRLDNRICNLRLASNADNAQNRQMHRNNKSGFMGVSYFPRDGKWRATIRCSGKQHYIGSFDTAEEAALAYESTKRLLHTFNPVV